MSFAARGTNWVGDTADPTSWAAAMRRERHHRDQERQRAQERRAANAGDAGDQEEPTRTPVYSPARETAALDMAENCEAAAAVLAASENPSDQRDAAALRAAANHHRARGL